MKYFNDVKQFHDKFGLITPSSFVFIPPDLHEFRVKFFREELAEYIESFNTRDLPMVIDALIDLVYITCGAALLHGLNFNIFEHRASHNHDLSSIYHPSFENRSQAPRFLEIEEHNELKQKLSYAIESYCIAYDRSDSIGISNSFHDLYWSCFNGANQMGFYEKRWNMLWDDVQRCNLSKERVLKAADSKRGSIYDVRKPVNWTPPRSEELVEMMIRGEA